MGLLTIGAWSGLKDENNELGVDDAAKIVGCWKALAKQGLTLDLADDASPMKRAVAFRQVIKPNLSCLEPNARCVPRARHPARRMTCRGGTLVLTLRAGRRSSDNPR